MVERKMQVLWLRFLTEINKKTEEIPQELLDNPEISKAIRLVEESAYTREQLLGYEMFWDRVRRDKDMADDSKVERYCYDNDTINCDRYGGLYQWAEMMKLPSECNTKSFPSS